MLKHRRFVWTFLPFLLLLSPGRAAPVNDAMLRSAGQDTSDWLMYGRTYDDHRFSPLSQINDKTVGKLGLAWSHELGSTRGLEGTPLEKDGTLYATGNWSVVYAFDAKTGALRWTYDPKVPRARALFRGKAA